MIVSVTETDYMSRVAAFLLKLSESPLGLLQKIEHFERIFVGGNGLVSTDNSLITHTPDRAYSLIVHTFLV